MTILNSQDVDNALDLAALAVIEQGPEKWPDWLDAFAEHLLKHAEHKHLRNRRTGAFLYDGITTAREMIGKEVREWDAARDRRIVKP